MVAGANKAAASADKIFKLAIVSGAHIGFGAYLALTVGGACFGIATENPGLQKVSSYSYSSFSRISWTGPSNLQTIPLTFKSYHDVRRR